MFPIRDSHPTRVRPWVTLLIIATSLYVFFGLQAFDTPQADAEFLYEHAAIGCEVTTGDPLSGAEIGGQPCSSSDGSPVFPEKQVWLSVLKSIFLHGGVGHVLFNMWFLWIFGNNVEEAFGHVGYLFFYVVGGVASTLAFALVNPGSTVPLVGASGAIAAVLGAYGVLFPGHRVLSFVGWLLLPIPAFIFLGIWFVAQFGLGGTNVAWEAHVGGFIFGLVASFSMRRPLLNRVRSVGYR